MYYLWESVVKSHGTGEHSRSAVMFLSQLCISPTVVEAIRSVHVCWVKLMVVLLGAKTFTRNKDGIRR